MSNSNMMSRRTFVASTGAAIAGASVIEGSAFASALPQQLMEHESFGKFIGSMFRLRGDLGAIQLKLTSIETTGSRMATPAGIRSQAFSARFSVHDNLIPLAEKTYKISHAELGSFELYLAPCGQGICTSEMVAIFN